MRQPRVSEMPATTFHKMVEDPNIFVGGGSVAALTGAGAGSTALLVMNLNVRRKSLAPRRPSIEQAIHDTELIVDACSAAADEDIRILAELLEAHRDARRSGDEGQYVTALTAAAESPLGMAETLTRLLDLIDGQIDISTRFTVSDLGAAAALAVGACQAALLTAEINIALLRENPAADASVVLALESRRARLRERASDSGKDIERRTRDLMLGASDTKETH
jgi:formiminotetrahydrofolate cyclodeaminase